VIRKVVNGNGEGLFLRASLNLRVVASKVGYEKKVFVHQISLDHDIKTKEEL
jgi:hypothetical protein